jgi:pentatricopeptide repeat protein
VFDAMPHRGIFAWNTMISAYRASGMLEDARALADAIPGGNVRTGTILLSGHARLGRVLDARRVFDGMLERNTGDLERHGMLLCTEWGYHHGMHAVRLDAEQGCRVMELYAHWLLPQPADGGCMASV